MVRLQGVPLITHGYARAFPSAGGPAKVRHVLPEAHRTAEGADHGDYKPLRQGQPLGIGVDEWSATQGRSVLGLTWG